MDRKLAFEALPYAGGAGDAAAVIRKAQAGFFGLRLMGLRRSLSCEGGTDLDAENAMERGAVA